MILFRHFSEAQAERVSKILIKSGNNSELWKFILTRIMRLLEREKRRELVSSFIPSFVEKFVVHKKVFVALKKVAPKNEKFGRDVVAQSQICKLWRLDRPLLLSQKILSKKSNYIIKLSS